MSLAVRPAIRPVAPHLIRFVEELFQGRNETEREFSGSISWDLVECDIEERLAVLGTDAIAPVLEALERLVEARRKGAEQPGGRLDLGMWDPASWVVRTLRELGEDAVPTLLSLMRHEDAEVRSDAADVLAGLKIAREDIRRYVRTLLDVLDG
jgi:hypothetical protein